MIQYYTRQNLKFFFVRIYNFGGGEINIDYRSQSRRDILKEMENEVSRTI